MALTTSELTPAVHRPFAGRWGEKAELVPLLGVVAIVLAYTLVRRSTVAAFALLLLPPAIWMITRRGAGLLVGLAMVLGLPYWQSLGSSQVTVLRVACLTAATSLILARRRLRPCATDYALVLVAAVMILGWVLQYDQSSAGHVIFDELTPVGFYLGARGIRHASLPRVMALVLVIGTVGAVTVIYEYLVGHPVFTDPSRYKWGATASTIFRPGGIWGSPPGASSVLCFVIVFGLAHVTVVRGRARWVASICLGISSLALILTFTRAALIGVGVAIVAFLWLMRSPLLRPGRGAWFAGATAVIAIVALPTLQTNATFQKGIARSGALTARESYWSAALPIALSSARTLTFGVGTGVLESPAISVDASLPVVVAARPQVFTNSLHSQYVTELVEQGIVGLAALALFLGAPLIRAGRVARARANPGYAALAASIIAVSIVMTVDTALLNGPTFALIMVAAGLGGTASAAPMPTAEQAVGK